jgi:hypothetical protein
VSEQPAPSRWTGLGEALLRFALVCVAAAVALGAIAAVIALLTGHGVTTTVSVAYYLVGCLLFLIGVYPTGGFSLVRGTMTRRRPIGAREEPIFLVGVVLVALGVIIDLYSF